MVANFFSFPIRTWVMALCLLAVPGPTLLAQNVGIGTATPDGTAMLDLVSTTRGVLVPRLTAAQRAAIASPAAALLVYQTDGAQPGFWFNGGTASVPAWTYINPTPDNLGNHTATQALNLQGQALVGTGASIGAAVGLGVRADGGLNIGQNTAGNNVFVGYLSGNSNTTGTGNQFIGNGSGQANTTGSTNQFIGYGSGSHNTMGNYNQFSGFASGLFNTSGSYNQFSGFQSGNSNTTGNNNQFSGYASGRSNTIGGNNLFVGFESGYANTTGTNNQFNGYLSGYANTTGNDNQFSGAQSGYASTGTGNLFTGFQSGYHTAGDFNQFDGFLSGFNNTSGTQNQFLGFNSGYNNTSGNNNQFSGYQSGRANTGGNNNHFDGYQSGRANTTGGQNLFRGYQSGFSNTTGFENQYDGYQSGYANTTGNSNVFHGYQSGYNNTGDRNQFVGYQSGQANTSGNGNQFDGYQSGNSNTTGYANLFNGYLSGFNNDIGSNNLFTGVFSGYGNTSGNLNTFYGRSSGYDNVTGTYNWGFGYLAGPLTGNLTYAGAIGTNAKVSQDYSLALGGTGANAVKVGIGTSAPRGWLDVATAGDSYLVPDPNTGNSQSLYLPGHLYLGPYNASTPVAYVQARIPAPTASTNLGLTFRTTSAGNVVNALTLNANGSAVFVGTVTAVSYSPSDKRLKHDVRPLSGALAGVLAMRGVRYQYRQHIPGRVLPAGEQVGVVAQEVEAIYPELVSTDADGYKAVNYAQLTPVLLEAIKEQQQQIETLKAQAAAAGSRAVVAEGTTASLTTAVQDLAQRLRALEAAGKLMADGH